MKKALVYIGIVIFGLAFYVGSVQAGPSCGRNEHPWDQEDPSGAVTPMNAAIGSTSASNALTANQTDLFQTLIGLILPSYISGSADDDGTGPLMTPPANKREHPWDQEEPHY
ncbi:MAG: hypothetical protein NTV06_02130 [candidate division Zixibacteria bacterium]|nr:hypothetical protein [candidate division Zixibacteria bacterium]